MGRYRNPFLILIVAALAALLVACGGGEEQVSASDDPTAVLERAFGSEDAITSAKIDAEVSATAEGDQGGDFELSLSGAVDEADSDLPRLDIDFGLTGSGGDADDVDFDAGMVLTGDAGFIKLGDKTYELDPGLFDQFKAQAEQQMGATGASGADGPGIFGDLKPENFLTQLSNEGETDIDGVSTVKISGKVDTAKAVAELKAMMGSAPGLQTLGVGMPGTDDLDEVADSVGDVTFNVYAGADDGLLRRMEIEMPIKPGDDIEGGSATITVNLSDVNEPQDIEAPSNARPFSELLGGIGSGELSELGIDGFEDLGNLGDLGGLGGILGGESKQQGN